MTAINWSFWIGSAYTSWNHLIPERFITLTVVVSSFFALPAGCCFLPFLVMAQLHDTGWRIATYGGLTLANGIAWAWVIDFAWSRLFSKPEARGFDVQLRETSAEENSSKNSNKDR